MLFVATLGAALLVRVATLALPDIEPGSSVGGFPTPFFSAPSRANPDATYSLFGLKLPFELFGVSVEGRHLLAILLVPAVVIGIVMFLKRSIYGLSIRASAANADAAQLAGVRPRRMSSFVWTLAGVLAVLTVALMMPIQGLTPGPLVEVVGPDILLRALAAALVGKMVSMPKALLAGIGLGIIEELIRFNVGSDRLLLDGPGFYFVLLFGLILIIILGQSSGVSSGREGTFSFSPRTRPIPTNIRTEFVVTNAGKMVGLAALLIGVVLAFVLSISKLNILSGAMAIALVGLSITILTGWAGQLSLGQFAIAGVGALGTASIAARGVPVGFDRLFSGGLSYAVAVPIAVAVCILVAMLVGAPALRVRGLFLAVTTLGFAVMCDQWLFRREVFVPKGQQSVQVVRGKFGPLDLEDSKVFYLATLGLLAVAVMLANRIRCGGIGRTLIAVRDNEGAAAAYTVSPVRAKLTAFALAGGMAGLGGALLAGITENANPETFVAEESLAVVAMTIVGGVGTVAGPVIGALWVHGLPALVEFSDEINLVRSGLGLLIMLLYFPGGLVQVGYSARDAAYDWLSERRAPSPSKDGSITVRSISRHAAQEDVRTVLDAQGISVDFGGRKAVSDVDIVVKPGQVVGLIGANGAGKSTFMNAVGGYVPADGTVELLGRSIEGLAPSERAKAGLGRTFQSAELFQDLSVRETIQVALEARERTQLTTTMLALPAARADESRKVKQADEIIGFLGLGRYADSFISDLSTGTRRICELACIFALSPHLVCLDEPTAGVAQRETEAFGPLLLRVRDELDASLLVIEHDMPLIMSISDHVYCLEAGSLIASGDPVDVRNDPLVVASYLGTDERAIERSDH